VKVHATRRRLTFCVAAILLVVYALALLPGRSHDGGKLRSKYLCAVMAYEGTPYHNDPRHEPGINCVYLVAASLIKANIKRGVMTLNPRLVRRGVWLYWTRAVMLPVHFMQEHSRGMTRLVCEGDSRSCMTNLLLEPGDIGLMAGGHMLTYIGQGEWMEACAAAGKVIRVKEPTLEHGCLNGKMYVVRWTQFEE
jgi:hypothetical protein